jgi:hypothetical protein
MRRTAVRRAESRSRAARRVRPSSVRGAKGIKPTVTIVLSVARLHQARSKAVLTMTQGRAVHLPGRPPRAADHTLRARHRALPPAIVTTAATEVMRAAKAVASTAQLPPTRRAPPPVAKVFTAAKAARPVTATRPSPVATWPQVAPAPQAPKAPSP